MMTSICRNQFYSCNIALLYRSYHHFVAIQSMICTIAAKFNSLKNVLTFSFRIGFYLFMSILSFPFQRRRCFERGWRIAGRYDDLLGNDAQRSLGAARTFPSSSDLHRAARSTAASGNAKEARGSTGAHGGLFPSVRRQARLSPRSLAFHRQVDSD